MKKLIRASLMKQLTKLSDEGMAIYDDENGYTYLDEIDPEGNIRRVSLPFSLRYVYRFEMELLLEAVGFTVKTIYGSYEMDPFDSHSPRMIFVARKQSSVTAH